MSSGRAAEAPVRHVPGLDGLRGAAVAAVLLYHGGHLSGGYLGVDLFFTLSGFLITSLLLAEVQATGGVGLIAFWGRRARRLLPALFGLLIGVSAFSWWWASSTEQKGILGDSMATLLYAANWRSVAADQGYWDQFGAPSPLRHTWSLAIEEQFYVLWPLVVLLLAVLVKGRIRGAVATFALVGAAASYVVMALLVDPGRDTSRAYFGTDARVGGILLGALLAALLAQKRARHLPARAGSPVLDLVALVAVGWLWWAWTRIEGTDTALYRGGFLLSALAALALIATAVLRPSGPIARGLSVAPLRGLGIISYGLYLWHWPVFVVLQLERERLGLDGWPLFAAQVAISLGLAVLSFVVIEQPIRTQGFAAWGRSGARWMPAAALGCIGLLVVITTVRADPRPAAAAVADAPVPTVAPDPIPAALVAPDTGPAPRPVGRSPRLLVVGDSVSIDLANGIAADPAARVDVVNRSVWACKISPGPVPWRYDGVAVPIEAENCPAGQRDRWKEAVTAFDPDAVLLAFGGGAFGEANIDGRWVEPCSTGFRQRWRAHTLSAIDLLAAQGAVVWVMLPARPEMVFEPADLDESTACLRDVYAEAARARPDVARTLPLDEWVCPGDECLLERDGVTLRPDGLHFKDAGRALASAWVIEQLFQPPR